MSGAEQDAWKPHAHAALGDIIGALGSIYAGTRLERLVSARANLEHAIETLGATLPRKEFGEGSEGEEHG